MPFRFSKSKFVSACTHCNKYAWLDKYKPGEKAPVDEFTQSLFDNGHKVGALAQRYFCANVDVTTTDEAGHLNLAEMIRKTQEHIALQTPVIAEASFSYGGFFCSVDLLVRNADGSYDLCEVKSSKPKEPTKQNPMGIKEKYILDAAYQQYVLEHCAVKVNRVYVVLLNRDYVRGATFDLDQYFIKCDVTAETTAKQSLVAAKLSELEPILKDSKEPASVISDNCNKCDYFAYCGRNIPYPSAFDLYGIKFPVKRQYYEDGVDLTDIPKLNLDLKNATKVQIAYLNRPNDTYIDKTAVQSFLDTLQYPLYSLDFETYQAIVPAFEGVKTYEQLPFQYSVHVIPGPAAAETDVAHKQFLDLSGGDPRRKVAESLVDHIPYGAMVVAYHKSTEKNIIKRLSEQFPDLADHLRSYTYFDPLEVFEAGSYYTNAMGKSFSLKSVAPALYPDDPRMDYHNLEGNVKNGTQAMNAILKVGDMTPPEIDRLRRDLETYCALDTLAVVKILQKFYEVTA